MKKALVCGAGGFIGSHLVKRLKREGYWVCGIDLQNPAYSETHADEFVRADLRDPSLALRVLDGSYSEVYQLAADMGGAGYIFTGENDANVMHNSATINLNMLEACRKYSIPKVFYSSSACVYPAFKQSDPDSPDCREESAYPAEPDSEYGWEKLFSERLHFAYQRNFGIKVKVARFHNIFGEEGTWTGGKEKAPAAICRKVAEAEDGEEITIWGDGRQTRSFLYVAECIEGVRRLMESDFDGPVNIGSEEMISLDRFAQMVIRISGKRLGIRHEDGPTGVRGRNSNNDLLRRKLGWAPSLDLESGVRKTYRWIAAQVDAKRQSVPATFAEKAMV